MTSGTGLPVDIRQIDDQFYVAGQITPGHVEAIAKAGYAAIICNRPDNEAPGQPAAGGIRAEAERLGLAFFHIPVVHAGITQENVDATRQALAEVSGPVMAYCRSGARSTNLYGIARS